VVRAYPTSAKGLRPLVPGNFQKLTQQGMGTRLSSKLGKVKVMRKKGGAPPQLNHCLFLTWSLAKGQPLLLSNTYDCQVADYAGYFVLGIQGLWRDARKR